MKVTQDWKSQNVVFSKWEGETHRYYGTCAGLAMHWIKQVLKAKQKRNGPFGLEQNNAIAAQYIHVKNRHDDPTHKGTWRELYEKALELKPNGSVQEGTGTKIDPTSSHGTYGLVITGKVGDEVAAHMVAFRRDDDHSSFYDPNFGQFSVTESVLSNFKSFVNEHIKTHYSWINLKWEYNEYKLND